MPGADGSRKFHYVASIEKKTKTAYTLYWSAKCASWTAPSLEGIDDYEAGGEVEEVGGMDEEACSSKHFSLDILESIHDRLANEGCTCGGTRVVQKVLDSEAQAEHWKKVIHSAPGRELIDPNLVLPADLFTIEAATYLTVKHDWPAQPAKGGAPNAAHVKMYRYPLEEVRDDPQLPSAPTSPTATDASLPVPPWWFELWLGDGSHDDTSIKTVDLETKEKTGATVEVLNENVPAGKDRLEAVTRTDPQNGLGTLPIMTVRISSGKRHNGSSRYWNPVREGLRQLGVFANHKISGVSLPYREATRQWIRAAVIAGMLDSDGTLINNGTGYKISQCEAHLAILIHIRKMCLSIGIRVGKVEAFETPHPIDSDTMLPAYRFSMYGSGLEKLQPYLMPRKRRLQREYRDKENKGLRVDPLPRRRALTVAPSASLVATTR